MKLSSFCSSKKFSVHAGCTRVLAARMPFTKLPGMDRVFQMTRTQIIAYSMWLSASRAKAACDGSIERMV